MARLFTLVAFIAVTHLVGVFRLTETTSGSATLFLGFLLLASFLAGRAVRTVGLPQITGYLVIGMVLGPFALEIIPAETVAELAYVNEVALALIALSAGGELRLEAVRERIGSIGMITAFQIVFMFFSVAAAVYWARGTIGFLQGQPATAALAASILFGLVAVAKSPATTIAVITEERARGILTDTVLGITVLKDVIILILVALLIPLSSAIVDPASGFSLQIFWNILLRILGSLAVGMVLGWFVNVYLRKIRAYRILFVLGVAFLAVYLGEAFHLEYILIAMAAGFSVQNFSKQGRRLLRALEANSLPVYALFFAVAGAALDFTVLRTAWMIAGAIILTRAVALWLSTYLAARMVSDPPSIRRHAWMGFMAQAGVTLGIANIIRDGFPIWGEAVATVIIAMIAVNQLVGPPAFRWALVRTGESHADRSKRRRRR